MRDPTTLAAASAQAVTEGAWPMRYASEADEPALRDLLESYRTHPEWCVFTPKSVPWTVDDVAKSIETTQHPLVLLRNGAIIGFVAVHEVSASEPPMMIIDNAPTVLTLTADERTKAQLSMALTVLLFLQMKGVSHAQINLNRTARSTVIFGAITAPREVGTRQDGTVQSYSYTGTVAHALTVIRSLVVRGRGRA